MHPELHVKYINQSSQYPCTDNTLQVILASNVPLRKCTPSLTLTGLDSTLTNSTTSFSVNVLKPAVSSKQGNWSNDGTLHLDVSTVVPETSCSVFAVAFTLKNQKTARSAATVEIELNGLYGFKIQKSVMTTPSGRRSWYAALPGMNRETVPTTPAPIAWTDPLVVKAPAWTKTEMGQTNPWPGTENIIHVTLATNVPLTVFCSTIQIIQLEGACANSHRLLNGTGASAFRDLEGHVGYGSWSSVAEPAWTNSLEPDVGTLTLKPSADTNPYHLYVFNFKVTNPVDSQNSPGIQVRALGIPIAAQHFTKELQVPATQSPCHNLSIACRWNAGDAAPLRVYAPMFLIKDIGQSTPYPTFENTLSVTLLSNIPISVGALITISNLAGAVKNTGSIPLLGNDKDKFQAAAGGSAATGYWDADAEKLTMRVITAIDAGALIKFTFALENPKCNRTSPAVCVRASRISTECLDCTQGECVTLSRAAMDRDFVRILDYGTKGHPNYGHTAYFDASATVTYSQAPPAQGDAAPLLVYAPSFVVANITQSNPN